MMVHCKDTLIMLRKPHFQAHSEDNLFFQLNQTLRTRDPSKMVFLLHHFRLSKKIIPTLEKTSTGVRSPAPQLQFLSLHIKEESFHLEEMLGNKRENEILLGPNTRLMVTSDLVLNSDGMFDISLHQSVGQSFIF